MLSHYECYYSEEEGKNSSSGEGIPREPPLYKPEYWYNIPLLSELPTFHIPRDLHSSLSFLFRFPDTDKLSPPILQLSDVMMYTCMHTCISFPVFVLCVFSACFMITSHFLLSPHAHACMYMYVPHVVCVVTYFFCICLHEKHAQMYVCTCMSYSVFLQVAFGYEKNIVFKNMNISADMETRIALVSHSMETASTVELL